MRREKLSSALLMSLMLLNITIMMLKVEPAFAQEYYTPVQTATFVDEDNDIYCKMGTTTCFNSA